MRPELVLVGGGHSHVQVLRMHRMRPLDARVSVVVDRNVAVYSGMVPGFVARNYSAEELEIDVRPLARGAGVAVVEARCLGIDLNAKTLLLEGRPPIAYDLASINIGSTVASTELPGVREHALPTRPIGRFVRDIDRIGDAEHVVVVGAGAGGIELAFCLQVRLGCKVTLVAEALLPERPALHARLRQELARRGIDFVEDSVRGVDARGLDLAGSRLDADGVVWVTGAVGVPFEGLETDPRGFLLVDDVLQAAPGVFAVGDCAHMRSHDLPKAGVYAVRQGPVLFENLHRSLEARPLASYEPQRDFLALLNLGDGTAIGGKWGRSIGGASVFALKDRIDRAFMKKFQVLGPAGEPLSDFSNGMPPMPEVEMVCGGCAAKVAETPLSRALARLPPLEDEELVLGFDKADDAAALQRPSELVVQSVDVFPAFTDDPFIVGEIAAANSTSDLFATGVRPRVALAIVTLPEDLDPEETLFQVLSGIRAHLDAEGCTLMGGHTTLGEKLTAGLSVTGFTEGPLWRNGSAKVGDALVLSRGLGTGVLFHADMAGLARGDWISGALARMRRGNGPAARALDAPNAVTDITGFGLAGHLGEMLRAEGLGACIELSRVPALPGAIELLARGERSTFHEQNRRVVKAMDVAREVADDLRLELLFDPQTAGGLLVATSDPEGTVTALHAAGELDAAVVGVVEELGVASFRVVG